MQIKSEIQNIISKALKKSFEIDIKPDDIHLEHPQDESHGDWSTNIAMTLAKELNKAPSEIAETLIKLTSEDETSTSRLVGDVKFAQPGFINFTINPEVYKQNLKIILDEKESFGNSERLKGKRIMVEFAHPNPFKQFHIGHLRNIFLGESIVRLLESQGAEVIRTNYQGDVGMHIAKNIWAFRKVDPKDYPKTPDEQVSLLGKLYAQGATAFEENEKAKEEIKEINKKIYSKEDPEINKLWELGKKWSLDKFHEIYERVYTHFAREYMESETLEKCAEYIKLATEKGILEESEGALVFKGEKYGLHTRVFQNSQGLPTYEGKDLGLAYMQFTDFGEIDLNLKNVAVEHIGYFKVLFKVLELLDPKMFKDKFYHLAYEFVGLKKGKMSSRKGNVILGNDILNEAHARIAKIAKDKGSDNYSDETAEIIGVGAVKYSFLKISPFKYLAFDLDASLNFEGDSGPYVQYTYARAKSVLEKSDSKDKELKEIKNVLNSDAEISLIKWLYRFPEIVQESSIEYTPNTLCTCLYELSQRYNSFYKEHRIIDAENEESKVARLALTSATAQVIKNGLYLLGIKTVEKM
jgi:arginyl-tRNA synthetase